MDGEFPVTSAKTPHLLATLPLLAALLSACSSTPVAAPTPTSNQAVAPAAATVQSPAPRTLAAPTQAPVSIVATARPMANPDPRSDSAAGRSVYFDFDTSLVRKEFEPLIERHGKMLIADPKVSVRIEGHTDERGSHEYNLALGQRRAQAVLAALKVYGVKDAQMEAVSWGEERPRATDHDESAWAQNRRADLAYPKK
ncbi:MAG: peptidoglycan-associated lipoprotein Pal [Rubrivivax sp.]|jgi:peptidoglycan-associated lipoprotein|nr:peptidoglycan-associated lipoprotein Pal [Rubrivivax sp.]